MSLRSSWQFIGGVNARTYRMFDRLRCGVNRRLVRYLGSHLPTSPEKPFFVLESGSGPAFATSLFTDHREVRRAVCLDIDETALQEAKRRDPRCLAVVGDMCNLPFRSNCFALIFNSSTVEHLESPRDAIREMARVCRNDGRVFVGVPYLFGPLIFQPLIRRTVIGEWLGPVFSRRRLARLLASEGLRPIESIRYFLRFFIGTVATKGDTPIPLSKKVCT